MNRLILLFGILLVNFLVACTPKAPPAENIQTGPITTRAAQQNETGAKEPWEAQWNKWVSEAKKEEWVIVLTGMKPEARTALASAFKEEYGIKIEYVMGRGAEISQKLMSERKSGLYLADVHLSGATTPTQVLKPAGILDPLESVLILPEIKDLSLWWQGEMRWLDKDKFVLAASAFADVPYGINSDLVKPAEVASYLDLLNPKWSEKIVMADPTKAGKGLRVFTMVSMRMMGEDYFKELAKQKPAIVEDRRLQIEWLAKGKYPIAFAPEFSMMKEFKDAGAPVYSIIPQEGSYVESGFGTISIMNKAAHPNATKVFTNWFLSKKGQTVFSKSMDYTSARIDVPRDFLPPDRIPVTGKKYYAGDDPEVSAREFEYAAKAREIFGPLLR